MMQMQGEQRIAAPRQKVWAALNDPDCLQRAIPGCQSLNRTDDDRFDAVAEVKIGPIGARFKGHVTLSDIDAPNRYTISGTGSGGIAGNAQGIAKVELSDEPGGGTLLRYTVEAEVGGRMAQLGGPIIDATAKNLAAKFFSQFDAVVTGQAASPAALAAPVTTTDGAAIAPGNAQSAAVQPSAPGTGRGTLWGWVIALIAALTGGYVLGQSGAGAVVILTVLIVLVLVAVAAFEAGRRGGAR